ncbi:cytochrome c [Nitrogeniibacter mangrovi]|uniref:Cytochrome c n=1 Tax=Nitrogeniibacter mangrovi TaxID=2016596 RepID=A0A6C1B069_9RHOO|nr:cytochrome c [Nitrogeniibacter mangrovi]QID16389.1 cytochrome c [Nitrogeniibacter mangrovi]
MKRLRGSHFPGPRPLTGLALLGLVAAFAMPPADAAADPGARHDAPPEATVTVPSAEQLRDPVWIAAGKQKFIHTCAYCHGTEGEAGKTRSFKTRTGWDPRIIHDTIVNGRVNGPNVMPSWKGSIPDPLVWKIVAYIKSLSADFEAGQQATR